MYTIQHAERAFRQHPQTERALKRYSIAILKELCTKRGIQVDVSSPRHLKAPYINALLAHVR